MNSSSDKISVLILGASGKLGNLLTKEALKRPNFQVSILVRNPDKVADLAEDIKKSGGNIIKGDLSDASSLTGATKGIHTIISASKAHEGTSYVDGHVALIKDAEANGVARLVENWFSSYSKGMPREEVKRYKVFEQKNQLQDYLNTSSLKTLSIYVGTFMETLLFYQKHAPGYWGEAGHVHNLVSYADTAAYTIAAVANKDQTGELKISGDDLTTIQAIDLYNKVRGTNVELKRNGSLAELKDKFEESLKEQNPMKILLDELYLVVFDSRSYYAKNDNGKYPEVKFSSFEEFLKKNPEEKL